MPSSVPDLKNSLKTLTVGIVSLNTQNQVHWNDMMAASVILHTGNNPVPVFPEILYSQYDKRSSEKLMAE